DRLLCHRPDLPRYHPGRHGIPHQTALVGGELLTPRPRPHLRRRRLHHPHRPSAPGPGRPPQSDHRPAPLHRREEPRLRHPPLQPQRARHPTPPGNQLETDLKPHTQTPCARRREVAETALGGLKGVETDELELTDLDNVHAFADRCLDTGRHIDILINNAGVMACPETPVGPGRSEEHTPELHSREKLVYPPVLL